MAASNGTPTDNGPYQVVARRFRPQRFQELVGQDDVLQSLRTALAQKRVPHAFIFSGSRGVGKTTSARILARCLNCEKGPTPEPCGTCDVCRSILDGTNPDIVEIDAASNNGVDDVRALREHTAFASMRSRYRVFILDEVHMLSRPAFNALLKTLEEPPPQVVFVLATTELHKVPETIRSRCQVLLFRRVGEADLQKRLAMIAEREGVAIPAEVLAEIASSVRGGVRDAETELERILPLARAQGASFDLAAYRALVSRMGLDATAAVVASLLQGDAKAALHFARDLQRRGVDEREALGEIVEALRAILLLKVDGADSALVNAAGSPRDLLVRLAAAAPLHQLDAMLSAGVLGRDRLRRVEDRGAVLELSLLRMAQAGTLPTLADLVAEVRAGGGAALGRQAAVTGAPLPPPVAATASVGAAAGGDLRARVIATFHDRPLQQTTIEQCRIDGPNAQGVVVVTVQGERRMYRDRMASPGLQQEVTAAIRSVAGADVRVEYRVGADGSGESAGPSASPAPAPPPKVEPGPEAKRVMNRFRGRIVEVNPADRAKPGAAPRQEDDGAPVDEQPPDLQE
ncbi:MAG: DNA polymerase III subunit gamma/tau [Planctomycetes bacterium]|nr:DNA polymerase III subunit gamma/tau [Planctomycetota bacterium]